MRNYNDFYGSDLELLLRYNGFVTAGGAIDRQRAADLLGICKRTIGYMLNDKISKQMYNILALHTGHYKPGLVCEEIELDCTSYENTFEVSAAFLPYGFDSSKPQDVAALNIIQSLNEQDYS